MSLFLISFFPIIFCLLYFGKYDQINIFGQKPIKHYLLGIVTGFIYSFIIMICTSNYRQVANFLVFNCLYLYIFDLFIPVGVLFLLCFITSRKPSFHKVRTFSPLSFGFYTIFFPYMSLFRYETVNFYCLFVKPVLFVCVIISIMQMSLMFCKYQYERRSVWEKILLIFVLVIISLFLCVIESLYITKIIPALYICMPIILIAFGIFVVINSKKLQNDYLY